MVRSWRGVETAALTVLTSKLGAYNNFCSVPNSTGSSASCSQVCKRGGSLHFLNLSPSVCLFFFLLLIHLCLSETVRACAPVSAFEQSSRLLPLYDSTVFARFWIFCCFHTEVNCFCANNLKWFSDALTCLLSCAILRRVYEHARSLNLFHTCQDSEIIIKRWIFRIS